MGLVSLIIVLSAFFVYWDCTRNGIGKIPDEKSILNNSAAVWAWGTCLLWIIVFPLYVFNRKRLKQKATIAPQNVPPFRRNFTLGLLLIVSVLVCIGQFSSPVASNDDSLLDDVSGVWQGSDGTMVIINFVDSSNRQIQINDTVFSVTVDKIDLANQVVIFTATFDDEKDLWSIQKIPASDESFQLLLTLTDGVQDQLHFVRNNI